MKTQIDLLKIFPTHAFVIPGECDVIGLIDPATGRSCINGHSLDDIRVRYPNAEIVEIESWRNERDIRTNPEIIWMESSEEKYHAMLCILPPRLQGEGGFLVGERHDFFGARGEARYQGFLQHRDVFLMSSRPMTATEFEKVTKIIETPTS